MKTFYSTLLLFAALFCNAQEATTNKPDTSEESIYNIYEVQVQPEFPGGSLGWNAFVKSEIKVPKTNGAHNKVKVHVSFIVEKDGKVTNVKILKDPGYNLNDEVVRAIQSSPKWRPGIINGQAVRTLNELPIIIEL